MPTYSPAPTLWHLSQSPPQLQDALKFGGAEFAAKLTMYIVFERLWLLV